MYSLHKKLALFFVIFFNTYAIAAEHTVKSGESLSKIIVEHGFTGNSRDMYYETQRIYEQNKHAFAKNNKNLLIPGKSITLPDYEPPAIIAGTLKVIKGEAKIIRENSTIPVTQTSELISGDIILTLDKTNCQIDTKDGALFELGAHSKFSIDDYAYKNEDNLLQKSSRLIVTLFNGIARAVTGKIGRTDKQQFQFKTVIATIGIRGTDYTVRYCDGNNCGQLLGTSVAVVDGSVVLKTDSGELAIKKGEFAIAASASSSPIAADMPEGFLDMNQDITQIKAEDTSWWKKLIEMF